MIDFSGRWFEEFKDKIDIVSVIQDFVILQKKGKNYWACCPFHNENTPSFSVNQEHKYYHCFGCGKKGDAIKFLQDYQNMTFNEAVEWLAQKIGFKLPQEPESNEAKKRREYRNKLLEINKLAAEFYFSNFKKAEATVSLDYLRDRGLVDNTIVKFGIGYSIDTSSLVKYLNDKGYSDQTIVDAGLINDITKNDIFARRITIPIINKQGDILGFGGRSIFEKDIPKYKNTAKTILFDKSSNLFGINLISKYKKDRVEINSLILVEGYMDVISLNQAGIINSVASMGTSLTQEQCTIIKKFVNNVYVCFDGDTAGQIATWRSLDMLAKEGIEIKVISIPDKMDPDDYVKNFGAKGFNSLSASALPLNEYKVKAIGSRSNLMTLEGRGKFVNKCVDALKSQDRVTKSLYAEMIADIAGVGKNIILEKFDLISANSNYPVENIEEDIQTSKESLGFPPNHKCLQVVLAACFLNTSYFNLENIRPDFFDNSSQKSIWDYCIDKLKNNQRPVLGDLISGNENISNEVFEIEAIMEYLDSNNEASSVYNDCLNKLNIWKLEQKRIEIINAITSEKNMLKQGELNEQLKVVTDILKRSKDDRKR